MKKLFLFSITLFSLTLNAAPPVTHQFTNGTTIEASQVNANYQELADRIEVVDKTAEVISLSTDVSVLQGQVVSLQNQITQLQNVQPKQLVGFTTADAATTSNYLALTVQCQVEFVDSRICTTKEIVETVNIPTLPSGVSARVAPSSYNSISLDGGTSKIVEAFVGDVGSTNARCLTVTSNLTSGGGFFVGCSSTSGYKVACCR